MFHRVPFVIPVSSLPFTPTRLVTRNMALIPRRHRQQFSFSSDFPNFFPPRLLVLPTFLPMRARAHTHTRARNNLHVTCHILFRRPKNHARKMEKKRSNAVGIRNVTRKLVKIFEWQFYPLASPYLARDLCHLNTIAGI